MNKFASNYTCLKSKLEKLRDQSVELVMPPKLDFLLLGSSV